MMFHLQWWFVSDKNQKKKKYYRTLYLWGAHRQWPRFLASVQSEVKYNIVTCHESSTKSAFTFWLAPVSRITDIFSHLFTFEHSRTAHVKNCPKQLHLRLSCRLSVCEFRRIPLPLGWPKQWCSSLRSVKATLLPLSWVDVFSPCPRVTLLWQSFCRALKREECSILAPFFLTDLHFGVIIGNNPYQIKITFHASTQTFLPGKRWQSPIVQMFTKRPLGQC